MNKNYIKNFYENVENKILDDVFTLSLPITLIHKIVFNKNEQYIKDKYGLNHSEIDVLISLYFNNKTQTPTELYESTIFSSGGMTKVLKKLEQDKYISRSPDENDKRSMLVILEKKGDFLAAELLEYFSLEINKIYSILDEEEKEVTKRALKKVLYSLS
jgi:DNA-binding MarR family transcriptional regulator